MRIPSGKTDQSIYFVAVDATDRVTRKTGLSSFTVYRSRNGGAATAYTTPTVTELSSSNMPGVYALLIDEDTAIASGSDSEEYAVHITATGMAPVSRTIELYRRDVTSGQTAAVDSSGRVDLGKWLGTAVTLTSGLPDVNVKTIKDGIIAAATFAANALDAVWSTTSRLLTAGTNIVLAKGTGITGLNDLDAAGVRAAVGMSSANLDTQLDAIPTNSDLTASLAALNDISSADVRTQVDAALAGVGLTTTITGRIDADVSSRLAAADYTAPPSAADNGAAVLDVVIADHLSSGSVGDAIYQAATHAINIDTQVGTAGAGLTAIGDVRLAHLDADVSSRLATSGYTAPDNAGVAAVKAKTDNLPASPAATGDAMSLTVAYDAAKSAASQASVDAIKASTDNLPADPADESLVIAATDAIMTRLGAPAGASVSADVAAVTSDTAAIKAKTDSLTFTVSGKVDANAKAVNDVTVAGLGTTGSPWGPG